MWPQPLSFNILLRFLLIGIFLGTTPNINRLQAAIESKTLPVLGKVKDFQLKDTTGAEFGLKQLKGKIWVTHFFYSSCTIVCPITTKQMAELQRSYFFNDKIELVSVTVDPEHDSWRHLAGYAKTYKADPRKWHFLTGPRQAIQNLVEDSFKISNLLNTMLHSALFVLVDERGRIRGYYDGTEKKDVLKLSQDIEVLFGEK